MKRTTHKDLGEFKVELQWEGNGNQIVLVRAASRQRRDWFQYRNMIYKRTSSWHKEYYYCLWGSAEKPIEELAPIECVTPTGRAQGLGASLKLFNQMVKSAQQLTMSNG
jgi:hypothetical protein